MIGALPVELGRVVGNREEHREQLAVRHLRGIVRYLHGFGVARGPGTDGLVVGGLGVAARVPGYGLGYAFDVAKYGLNPPEAAAGEYRRLRPLNRGRGNIDRRRRKIDGGRGEADGTPRQESAQSE